MIQMYLSDFGFPYYEFDCFAFDVIEDYQTNLIDF